VKGLHADSKHARERLGLDRSGNFSRSIIRRGILFAVGANTESVLEIDPVILDWLAPQLLCDASVDQTLEAFDAENFRHRGGIGSVVAESFLGQSA